MEISGIIIEIEKIRRRLYSLEYNNNKEKALEISNKLDILLNQYYKLKLGLTAEGSKNSIIPKETSFKDPLN